MHATVLLAGLALGSSFASPECRNPPPRASFAYWSYLEACGCAALDPVPRASLDYDRFLTACSQWRRSNPQLEVVIIQAPSAGSAAEAEIGLATPPSSKPAATPRPYPSTKPRSRDGSEKERKAVETPH